VCGAQQAGGEGGRADGRSGLAEVERGHGRVAGSLECDREAVRIRRRAGLRYDEAISQANRAGVHVALGDPDAAVAALERAADLAEQLATQDSTLLSLIDFQRGELELWSGRLESARELHRAALELRQTSGLNALVPASQIALAEVAVEDGRLIDAEALAESARFTCQMDERSADELKATALLIRTLADTDQRDEAVALLRESTDRIEQLQQPAVRIAMELATAYVESKEGRLSEALTRLDAVSRAAAEAGMVLSELQAKRLAASIATGGEAESRRSQLQTLAAESGFEPFLDP